MITFDPQKHYLGVLCKHGHDYEETGLSLRYKNANCIECQRSRGNSFYSKNRESILSESKAQRLPALEQKKINKAARAKEIELAIAKSIEQEAKAQKSLDLLAIATGLDTSKLFLGTLCSNNHEWLGTGKTARYIVSRRCPQCMSIHGKNRNQETHKNYLARTREARLRKKKEKRDNEKDLNRIKFREYYEKNRSELIAKKIAYGKTTQGRIVDHRCRAKRKNLLAALPITFTAQELEARLQSFDATCIYCGGMGNTIEHLIPIARGGTNNLENIFVACKSCNSSKNDSDGYEWYTQKPFFSEDRWKYICSRKSD